MDMISVGDNQATILPEFKLQMLDEAVGNLS
jgi:hypothetical protein